MNTLLAVFGLGGGEIVLILALILILFGARHLPDMSKGLGEGIEQFRRNRRNALDQQNWFRWNEDWANVITIVLLMILGMVILSLFAR